MADTTSLAESSQALFCALADYIGVNDIDKVFDEKEVPTYGIFRKKWEEKYKKMPIASAFKTGVYSGQVTLSEIEKFLIQDKDNEWYISSLKIAKKVLKEIDSISKEFNSIKRPLWSQIFYVRGDKEIMGNIKILFDTANETQKKLTAKSGSNTNPPFGDINKWSPADIYFASTTAALEISSMVSDKKALTFSELNSFIYDLIKKGELLPLSLKKQTKDVHIQKVNFSKPEELKKINQLKSYGMSDWKPRIKQLGMKNPSARDLKVYISADKKEFIQFEHGATEGQYKIIYFSKEMDARGGSIGSFEVFVDITRLIDGSLVPLVTKFKQYNKNFKDEVKRLGPKPAAKTPAGNKYREIRGNLSGIEVSDKINPELIKYFKNQERADKTIRLLYQYITSRLKDSAAFVIAK
jgi:hypothetical protein